MSNAMKYVLACACVLGFAVTAAPQARSSTQTPHLLARKISAEPRVVVSEPAFEESTHFRNLDRYVLDSMLEWAPASTAVGTYNTDNYASIAHDIVAVVLDPGEPALFKGDDDKSRTATLMTTMAYMEGHFWTYVDDGTCNKPEEQNNPLLKNGGCDSGEAYSLWQIHPGRGIVLFDNGMYGYRVRASDKGPQVGAGTLASPPPVVSLSVRAPVVDADALHDRRTAAKTALHMLRASMKNGRGLCEFTGERQPCDKALKRMKFATEWSASHPFKLD